MCSDYKQMKVSPEFHELLRHIQQARVDLKKEDAKDMVDMKKLTKIMTNMFNANMEILNSLIEVDIKE